MTNKPKNKNGAPRSGKRSHGVKGGTGDANRMAVAILEVLAGARTPAEAAEALGVSLPRYYQLETRGLEGLVAACEPRPKGKQPSLERRIEQLEQQLARTQRECARQQALVRVAQRSIGLKAPPRPTAGKPPQDRAGRRKRRPTVRALKAADALRKNIRTDDSSGVEPTEQEPPSS